MRIAILSDSVLTPTGYGNVTLELLSRLQARGHECFNLAHNYHGQTLKKAVFEDGKEINFTIIGAGNAQYFKDRLANSIKKYKFDIVMVLLDTFMIKENPYVKSWFEDFDFTPAKTLFYFPSDGRKFPLNCFHILNKVDQPVAMSKFGQQQVLLDHNVKSVYIPHGVNLKNFYPTDKVIAKKMFDYKPDDFVVGVVARNQGRKMLDRTIKAFAPFSKNKDNARLLLHLDPFDAAQVFDIQELIKEYKIENKVKFTGMRCFDGFTLNDMRSVYNCMDVFLLTTSGEGFGIPTIEAMSCGIVPVLTDYTTSAELTNNGDCGILIPVITEIVGTWNVERACVDIEKCAFALEKLYENPELTKQLGSKAKDWVVANYDWDKLEVEWEKLFNGLLE